MCLYIICGLLCVASVMFLYFKYWRKRKRRTDYDQRTAQELSPKGR